MESPKCDQSVASDLWIMALKYFKHLEAPANETYIMKALEHICDFQTEKDKHGKFLKDRE